MLALKFLMNVSNFLHFKQVEIDGETLTIDDTINLSSPLINTVINGSPCTIQLIARNDGGAMRLQYLGTKVRFCVILMGVHVHWWLIEVPY